MNKKVKIALTIGVIIVLVIIITLLAVFVFAKDKTPLTAEDFKTKMEEKGYAVTEETNQYVSYDENIKDVYIATSEEGTYEIEFYIINDVDYAKMFYNNNEEYFESTKGNTFSKSNMSLKNYSKYTLSTNAKYKVLSRVENTVIYINADDTYRDEIKSILKEIGY